MEESRSIGLISRRNSAVSKARDVRPSSENTGTTVRCCPRCRPNLTSCYRAPAGTRFEALADETINREWAGPANNEGCEAGDIEQVDLITYRSELRARRRHREELDRAEPIRQVHFKHGHQ